MQHYTNSIYAVDVCLSIRLSHTSIVPIWLNLGSRKKCCLIAQGL